MKQGDMFITHGLLGFNATVSDLRRCPHYTFHLQPEDVLIFIEEVHCGDSQFEKEAYRFMTKFGPIWCWAYEFLRKTCA